MSRLRLLIADDHPVVRAGLQGMLASQADFEVIGEAATGAEVVALAAHAHPDVILLDLRMPGMEGAAVITQMRQLQMDIPVLVLTAYERQGDILRAIEAGATGYLLKDAPAEQLFAAIRTVAQGKAALAPEVAMQLVRQISRPAGEALSEREGEILTLVAHGASNKEAARQLHISEATIKTHLIHIFNKLGVTDRTAAVTVALERGLLQLPEN